MRNSEQLVNDVLSHKEEIKKIAVECGICDSNSMVLKVLDNPISRLRNHLTFLIEEEGISELKMKEAGNKIYAILQNLNVIEGTVIITKNTLRRWEGVDEANRLIEQAIALDDLKPNKSLEQQWEEAERLQLIKDRSYIPASQSIELVKAIVDFKNEIVDIAIKNGISSKNNVVSLRVFDNPVPTLENHLSFLAKIDGEVYQSDINNACTTIYNMLKSHDVLKHNEAFKLKGVVIITERTAQRLGEREEINSLIEQAIPLGNLELNLSLEQQWEKAKKLQIEKRKPDIDSPLQEVAFKKSKVEEGPAFNEALEKNAIDNLKQLIDEFQQKYALPREQTFLLMYSSFTKQVKSELEKNPGFLELSKIQNRYQHLT